MPSMTQLKYALAVEKFRHFARAAQACHVSQPTLSMQLQKMEEELGLIIFDRTKNPILTTDQGHLFLQQARVALFEFEKLENLPKTNEGLLQGDFKIAVIPTLAPYLIPFFLKTFSERYPYVNLIIQEYQTESLINALRKDEIDAGILATPLKLDDLIERVLFYEPFVVYHNSKEKMFKAPLSQQDMLHMPLWMLEEGHCLGDQVLSFCRLKDRHQVFEKVTFASGNLETLKNLVLKCEGVTFLPKLATHFMAQAERDQHIASFKNPAPAREISLVSSRLFYKEHFLEALQSVIIETLPAEFDSPKRRDVRILPPK
jgi:LysR family transcriptional regulator, hydrogen peroxide-inducible genes activator